MTPSRRRGPPFLHVGASLVLVCSAAFAERKPLPRPEIPRKLAVPPIAGEQRFNARTQQWEEFDYKARIQFDERRGVYLFSWTNREGKRKVLVHDPPTKVDVIIESQTQKSGDGKAFLYSYTLRNLVTSQQKLQSFNLEIRAPISHVQRPDPGWYSTPFTDYLKTVLKAGDGWHWADTKFRRAGIPPGHTQRGYSFDSRGLPSVVTCYVNGYWKPLTFVKGESEDPPMGLLDALNPITWKHPHGMTVGPADPPDPFVPASFTEKILEYVSISIKQGWIESAQIDRHLVSGISEVQGAIEKGDKPRAAKTLDDLLSTVEREKEKSLLSEAYALLKFNLEYLRDNLKLH